MGASPSTKSEYREAIAKKQAEIARIKANIANSKTSKTLPHIVQNWRNDVARLQGDIAKLKAKMANAPK